MTFEIYKRLSVAFSEYKCRNAVLVVLLCGISIVIYHEILSSIPNSNIINDDPMNELLFNEEFMGSRCCSSWPLSHFIFFAVLGVFFPTCGIVVNIMGILWEFFEGGQMNRDSDGKTEYVEWWQGNTRDIFFNVMGFLFGKFIVANLFFQKG